MAREHGTHRQRAFKGLLVLCIGFLAVGLLVPAAAGAGPADADRATSDESDVETTEVVIDLSSWFDDRSVSITLELPSVAVSWLEAALSDLIESPAIDGSDDEPVDRSSETDEAPEETDDGESQPGDGESQPGGDDAVDDEDAGDESQPDDTGAVGDEETDDAGEDDQLAHEAQVERAIHDEVNQVHADHGLEALAFDDELAAVAREHSEDMAERGYFSHTSPEGETVGDRYAAAGISCEAWGENILYNGHGGESPEVIAERSVQQWLDSEPHRENILSDGWDSQGIGVATDGDELYATQNFGAGCN